jgi:hypothetical protein
VLVRSNNMASKNEEKILGYYNNLEFPGSYRSLPKFRQMLKVEKDIDVTYKTLRKILKSDVFYQTHFQKHYKIKPRKVFADGCNIEVASDLAFIDIKNTRYKYCYVFKDIFSKKMYGFPAKDAKGVTFRQAFGRYFKSNPPFKILRTDQGAGFLQSKKYLLKKNIMLLTKTGTNKSTVAEAAVKQVKNLLFKHLRYLNVDMTYWYRYLSAVISSYNNTLNDAIGMKPIDVTKFDDPILRTKLYPNRFKEKFPTFYKNQLKAQKISLRQDSEVLNTFDERPNHFKVNDPIYVETKTQANQHFKKGHWPRRQQIFRFVVFIDVVKIGC